MLKNIFLKLSQKFKYSFAKRALLYLSGFKIHKSSLIGQSSFSSDTINLFKISKNAVINDDSHYSGKCIIGEGSKISNYCNVQNTMIGKNTVVDRGAQLLGFKKIINKKGFFESTDSSTMLEIGNESYIGKNCILDGSGGLSIGSSVHITSGTHVWTHSSLKQAIIGDPLSTKTNILLEKVEIGNNVWIGGHCTIYPGVKIGSHSVILPNSVVNCNVEPYTVVAGSPAKLKKRLEVSDKKVSFL